MYSDLGDNANNNQEDGVNRYEVIKSKMCLLTIVILVGDTSVGKTSLLTK
jgi:hypothetical protein